MHVQSRPVTPLRFAHALTDKLRCQGPEFRDYRIGLARGLTAMRGPTTIYQEKDINALWTVRELFQKFTGMSRDNHEADEMRWQTAYQDSLMSAHEEWRTEKGVVGVVFTSVLKALCRPSTNQEILTNYDRLGQKLQALFTNSRFLSLSLAKPQDLGIVGSLASGNFGAFSDLDLAIKPGRSAENLRIRLWEKIRGQGIDLFVYREGFPVIWLNPVDLTLLRHETSYLRLLVGTKQTIPG